MSTYLNQLSQLAPRTDFGKAPPGYVPGLGRGAVGFTTRSDIGPARSSATDSSSNAPPPGFPGDSSNSEIPKEGDYSESRFDKFSGFAENLFGNDTYDDDDKAADEIYAMIDRQMEKRRKVQKEKRQREEEKLNTINKRPKLAQQFRDLKRGLASLSETEWDNVPEAKDMTRSRAGKKQVQTRYFTAAPDSVMNLNMAGIGSFKASINPNEGITTPMIGDVYNNSSSASAATTNDLTQLGKARDKVLSLKLDRVSDSVGGQTVVDPKGYLTSLNSQHINSETEISDIKKARLLLKSVITTNPKHPPGWIASARLEAEVGKILQARKIIKQGCKMCPYDEDIWLEAARLNINSVAKTILAKAVRKIPTSTKLWLAARDLEDDIDARRTVLLRALDMIPNSETLWKAAIEQEKPEDAKILLGRAVECVPQSVDLWLALARLETYENAKKVLNKARSKIPTDPKIWITAAKLEEANGNNKNINMIIKSAVRTLNHYKVVIERNSWLVEAENAEKSGSILTCHAIVRNTIDINVEEQDRRNTWTHDCERFLQRNSIETARAICRHMLEHFRSKESIWKMAANLEKNHGTHESLIDLLSEAIKYIPQSNKMWLMSANEKSSVGDFDGARTVLAQAFEVNPESEEIWLAAVNLEVQLKEYTRASLLLEAARKQCNTAHVWQKSAQLQRLLDNNEEEREMIELALKQFSNYSKLWMMLAQWYIRKGISENLKKIRSIFKEGVKNCRNAANLWINYARFEGIDMNNITRARAVLETARSKNQRNELLWLEAIRMEQYNNNHKIALQLLAKALQECKASGILWAHSIASAPKANKKSKSFDALKQCPNDANVLLAVARFFWMDRKIKKARDWFERTIKVNPDLGDSWSFYYKFEYDCGNIESQNLIIERCKQANPKHGDLWTLISKSNIKRNEIPTTEILKKAATLLQDYFPLYYYNLDVQL